MTLSVAGVFDEVGFSHAEPVGSQIHARVRWKGRAPHEEVPRLALAHRLGVPLGTVQSRLMRARAELRAARCFARELAKRFPVGPRRGSDKVRQLAQVLGYSEGAMPTLIATPTRIPSAGNKPKLIDEFVGHVNNGESRLSIAHMHSPPGWSEPGQTPEFDEYTIVLAGELLVESEGETLEVSEGQAVLVRAGEWVRYSSPGADGAEYIAVCVPAFAPDIVHRDS